VNRILARVIFGVLVPAPVFIFTGVMLENELTLNIGVVQLSVLLSLFLVLGSLSCVMKKCLLPTSWGEIFGK